MQGHTLVLASSLHLVSFQRGAQGVGAYSALGMSLYPCLGMSLGIIHAPAAVSLYCGMGQFPQTFTPEGL